MVAVVVEAGAVFYDRGDPYSSETEGLDVVELIDESPEITAPFGVVDVVDTVPAIYVIVGVAVIEAGCHGKVDGLVTKIGAVTHEGGCRKLLRHCAESDHTAKEHFFKMFHVPF